MRVAVCVAVPTKAASRAPRATALTIGKQGSRRDDYQLGIHLRAARGGSGGRSIRLERDGQRTTLVPVPDESVVAQVAVGLVDGGIELIELCGGFSVTQAAQVVEAVGGRFPSVGLLLDSSPSPVRLRTRHATRRR
jgi:hypothetical protein